MEQSDWKRPLVCFLVYMPSVVIQLYFAFQLQIIYPTFWVAAYFVLLQSIVWCFIVLWVSEQIVKRCNLCK